MAGRSSAVILFLCRLDPKRYLAGDSVYQIILLFPVLRLTLSRTYPQFQNDKQTPRGKTIQCRIGQLLMTR